MKYTRRFQGPKCTQEDFRDQNEVDQQIPGTKIKYTNRFQEPKLSTQADFRDLNEVHKKISGKMKYTCRFQ